MTQTVPDISPLMPMHQDPLLVDESFHNQFEWTPCTNGVAAERGTSRPQHRWHRLPAWVSHQVYIANIFDKIFVKHWSKQCWDWPCRLYVYYICIFVYVCITHICLYMCTRVWVHAHIGMHCVCACVCVYKYMYLHREYIRGPVIRMRMCLCF